MALNFILKNNFQVNNGMRPEARKIGVLITDGKSQDEIIFSSKELRDQGIELYAVGRWPPPPLLREKAFDAVVFGFDSNHGDNLSLPQA
jgi:hypothetical protein